MPIYAYKCESCGHRQDVLQKVSDAPLTVCPSCGQARFVKQVTAAGFQLKGSGWYATDFRGGGKPAGEGADGQSDAPAEKKSDAATESKSTASADKPAPAASKPGSAAADAA